MEGFSHGKTAFLAAIDQGGIRSFGFVQLAAKNLKSSKIPALFLKIDIARAFDTVLTHMSFGACWREWISLIFADSSWKILLDGRPGERIFHARGLRQGGPLSPMLFVLVMEVFNCFVFKAGELIVLSPLRCRGMVGRLKKYIYNRSSTRL